MVENAAHERQKRDWRPYPIYSDTEAEFYRKVTKIASGRSGSRGKLMREATISGRLSILINHSFDWRADRSARDRRRRFELAQARIIEERRMTLDVTRLRGYVDPATLDKLPAIAMRPASGIQRRGHREWARVFWRRATSTPQRFIRADGTMPFVQWAAGHPYGPRPTVDELNELRRCLKELREREPNTARREAFLASGMTREEAVRAALNAFRRRR